MAKTINLLVQDDYWVGKAVYYMFMNCASICITWRYSSRHQTRGPHLCI